LGNRRTHQRPFRVEFPEQYHLKELAKKGNLKEKSCSFSSSVGQSIVLRLWQFYSLRSPGVFFIIPDFICFGRCYVHASTGGKRTSSCVILGDSERQVAEKFGEAPRPISNNPVALHLRAMNMLYESLKANSIIVIVQSSAIETMQLRGLAGMTALTMGLDPKQASSENRK